MLSQKDVIGEWVPLSEVGASDIIKPSGDNLWSRRRNSKGGKWLPGLLWSQIDESLILRRREKDGDIEFDLKVAPMVLEELALYSRTPIARLTRAALPTSGPMILCEVTGWPYLTAEFRRKWRILAKDAGVSDTIKNMDSLPAGVKFRGS